MTKEEQDLEVSLQPRILQLRSELLRLEVRLEKLGGVDSDATSCEPA